MPLKVDYELKEAIDAVIANLMEFGLIDKWFQLEDAPTLRTLVATAQTQHDHVNGNVVLTIDHIIGALLIMAFGYILAIIAFLLERFVHRKVQQGTDSNVVIYLHQFLRPDRIECIEISAAHEF